MPTASELPTAIQPWDNKARLSLSPGLYVWLAFLVATCLASLFFVRDHVPPRWMIVGFISSHVLVVVIGNTNWVDLRKGLVSLTHVVCWSPGLVVVFVDLIQRGFDGIYSVWALFLVLVVSISLAFDLRDSGRYLHYVRTNQLPPVEPEGDSSE